MQVLIIGAGGHGQVVADTLFQMQKAGENIEPVGFVDDDPQQQGKEYLQLLVLGSIADIININHDSIIVAIGNNQVRKHLFTTLRKNGAQFQTAIHPRAIISPNSQVGIGSVVMAGVVVNTGSIIGENVILNTNATIDHHCCIEAHAHIAPGCNLGGGVTVKEQAFIGIGTTIMPRRTIGKSSTVGAGAVVTKDVLPKTTVIGIPALPISKKKQ